MKFKIGDKVIAYDSEAEAHGMIAEKPGVIELIEDDGEISYLVKIRVDFPSKGNQWYSNWFDEEDLRKIE